MCQLVVIGSDEFNKFLFSYQLKQKNSTIVFVLLLRNRGTQITQRKECILTTLIVIVSTRDDQVFRTVFRFDVFELSRRFLTSGYYRSSVH